MALLINQINSKLKRDISPIKSIFKNLCEYENLTKKQIKNVIDLYYYNNINEPYIIVFIIGDGTLNDYDLLDVNKNIYSLKYIFNKPFYYPSAIIITDLYVPNDYEPQFNNNYCTNFIRINNYRKLIHIKTNNFIEVISKELKKKGEINDIFTRVNDYMACNTDIVTVVYSVLAKKIFIK